MFLAALTDQQKLSFLTLADAIIRADDQLAPQEEAMLVTMRAEMGLPDDVPVPAKPLPEAASGFRDKPSRIAAMLELTGLCLADGEVAPQEEDLLSSIGHAMGFGAADLLRQRDWVLRQLALGHEAKAMMMEGE